MISIGIIGGAGYTAGELLRILLNHPQASISFVYSTSQAGAPVHKIHQDLLGDTDMKFDQEIIPDVDVVFLCLGHGNSSSFLKQHSFSDHTKIIDLSTDFRQEGPDNPFVYGLPEFKNQRIRQADFVANPGCFATAINLALLPLAAAHRLKSGVHLNGVTGSTGAGTSLSPTSHFSWRDSNFSTYKAFTHQHMEEVSQQLGQWQAGFNEDLYFIPNRGNFSRGIHLTAYTDFEGSLRQAIDLYNEYYEQAAFTFVTQDEIHLKQVVNTNKCLLRLQKFGSKLLVTSVLDNLVKGASGQAVQNMNLMFGLEETSGLKLKATYH